MSTALKVIVKTIIVLISGDILSILLQLVPACTIPVHDFLLQFYSQKSIILAYLFFAIYQLCFRFGANFKFFQLNIIYTPSLSFTLELLPLQLYSISLKLSKLYLTSLLIFLIVCLPFVSFRFFLFFFLRRYNI